jgi:hypothetical protein
LGLRRGDPGSYSLDRRNNDLGYVPGNVVVVSLRANQLKNDATVTELRQLADFYGKNPPLESVGRDPSGGV